jgi:spermidine synthase
MLGLGGAAIAHALSPYMDNFKICAVEQSEEIISLAAQYFMTDRIPNLEIIHEEASIFVRNSPQQFKHMMIDLFNAESFPATCCNDRFFADCKRMLVPDGFLAVNLANRNEQRPIFEMIRKQFSSATIAIPVRNCANLVLVACQDEQVMPFLDIFKRNKQLKKLTWDERWGCVAEFR